MDKDENIALSLLGALIVGSAQVVGVIGIVDAYVLVIAADGFLNVAPMQIPGRRLARADDDADHDKAPYNK